MNTFIYSRSSLENDTRFSQTKMHGQSVYLFSDQNGAKTLPEYGTACNYIAYVYPPPPPHTHTHPRAHIELLLCYSVIAQRLWVALVISTDIYFRLIELQPSVKL